MICITVPLYTLGYDDITLESPFWSLGNVLFSLLIAGVVLQNFTIEKQFIYISCYISGIGLEALIIAVYSFFISSGSYGYGMLYNPFLNLEINSPVISNNIAIFSVFLFGFFFYVNGFYKKILISSFLLCSIILSFFLGGRFYFILIFFSLLYVLYFIIRKGRAKLLFTVFILSVLFCFIPNLTDLIFLRFKDGLSSSRFEHFSHALYSIPDYPFGGFSVNQKLESIGSFHNIFFDLARLGGWLPLFSMLFLSFYLLFAFFRKKNKYFYFVYLLFLSSFLVMQQDVVIEGNIRILILFYFSGILLINKKYSESIS